MRSWWNLGRNKRVKAGDNIAVRAGFELRMCDTAEMEIGNNCIINENVFFHLTRPTPKLRIGEWVTFGRYTSIGCKGLIEIGSYTQIGMYAFIIDANHSFRRGDLILNQAADIGSVVIGSDCWLGAYVKVMPNVTIGDGVVVAAGSVVTKDAPACTIIAGVPATVIGHRS